MSKRIFFTVINDLTYDQRMQRICSTLASNGWNCTLVGRKLPHSVPLNEELYQQKRLVCWVNKGILFYVEYNIRLFFFLLLTGFDGVCSIDVDTVLPGLILCKLKGRKHVFDAHELFTEVPEVKDRKTVKKVWGFIQKMAFQKTHLAYTVGYAIAAHFEKMYGKKVQVVRNIPPVANRLKYQPDADKFILYQGALNRGRGLENLILAMKSLPCKLTIAGEGDLSASLRQLVKDIGVEEKVFFLGYVPPVELKQLTTRAWMGMNVSENDGLSYYLSMNNKFFDYLHAGLPSLLNDFPEYRNLNNEYKVGVLCNSDVDSLTENALKLLTDDKLHTELSQNCMRASEVLNWEMESKKLIEIYSHIFEK